VLRQVYTLECFDTEEKVEEHTGWSNVEVINTLEHFPGVVSWWQKEFERLMVWHSEACTHRSILR
jgi:hypothetical protein